MLLVIDVGNTNMVLGVYKKNELIAMWRLITNVKATSDELGMSILQLFAHENISIDELEQAMIASVVPDIMYSLRHALVKYFSIHPMVVGENMNTVIRLPENSAGSELGADRLCACVAAYVLYKGPVLVVDYGTASTYDLVDEDGTFLTGITAPGIKISADALTKKAALLYDVELKKPKSIIVSNTTESIQAGLIYGRIGETIYICEQIKREFPYKEIKIVATGGLCRVLGEEMFDIINPYLTLEGLRILYEHNQ